MVEAAMFALLGLLIAFTFATAYSRFNVRRDLVVQEANAIGTAYLRLDLLPMETQPPLREKFRAYVDSRPAFWEDLTNRGLAQEDLNTSTRLQGEIWSEAVKASEDVSTARMLLLPALNEMIDITTTRLNAILARPPPLIFIMLFVLAILCAWLIGHAMALALQKPNCSAYRGLRSDGYGDRLCDPRHGVSALWPDQTRVSPQDMLVEVRKNITQGE
ncbi:MAG: hypothetical protein R3D01_09040 [Hyphomicrobiales bacterium]